MANLKDLKVNHESYISLHVQLHNLLRQLIVSGHWRNGDRIPSEPQLAQSLKISRSTVRIALQSAELEGLITRSPGRGTFVTYQPGKRQNTQYIGYVTRNFHNDIHRVLLSSTETELRSADYRVIFSNAHNNDEEVLVLQQLLDDNIQGLILWPNANPTADQIDILQRYRALGIPIVFVDRRVDGIEADYVASDNFGGTVNLVSHLVELGHRHILYLCSNIRNLFPIEERLRGYRAVVHQHHLHAYQPLLINSPPHNFFLEADIHTLLDTSSDELIAQIIELLQKVEPLPTAIACVNDALAILTMRALKRMGLQVPTDISVVGFDDIDLAAYMPVPLTTVLQDAHTIGQVAARLLLDRLDGFSVPPRHEVVPTHLQIRMSSSTPISSITSLSAETAIWKEETDGEKRQ